MFDLPMESTSDKRNYRKFRRFLIQNGYVMMQYSVYSKIILNRSVLNFQKVKIKQNAPRNGYVELLVITEKQYTSIESIVWDSERTNQENTTSRTIEL